VEVESFPTERPAEEAGSVEGFAASRPGDTWCVICGEDSCGCTVEYYTLGIC
jgi:hypothetical protein